MALLIRGVTRCPICKRVIEKEQGAVTFASFVANEVDPLRFFSDNAFHAACLVAHPLGAEATRRSEEYLKTVAPGQRRCAACGREVVDVDDYIGFGHLANDAADPLYVFNNVHLHRSHIQRWSDCRTFYSRLRASVSAGKLRGPLYDLLLRDLESCGA